MERIIVRYKYKGEEVFKQIDVDWIPRVGDVIPDIEIDDGLIFPYQVMAVILPRYSDGGVINEKAEYPVCYCAKTTYKNLG